MFESKSPRWRGAIASTRGACAPQSKNSARCRQFEKFAEPFRSVDVHDELLFLNFTLDLSRIFAQHRIPNGEDSPWHIGMQRYDAR